MEELIQRHAPSPDVTEVDVKEMLLRFALDCRKASKNKPSRLELDAIRELRATTTTKRTADTNDEVLRILMERDDPIEIQAVAVATAIEEAQIVPALSVLPSLAEG